MYKYVLARVIWPATFARSAGPPGGQNGRTDIYRKIIAAVRLGGLARVPARPIIYIYIDVRTFTATAHARRYAQT